MSKFRPYGCGNFRGNIVVFLDGYPLSVNHKKMYPDGHDYVDSNLDIYDSYSDSLGSSRVICFKSYNKASNYAEQLNDENELFYREKYRKEKEEDRRYEQQMAEHWQEVDRLMKMRRLKRKWFFKRLKLFFVKMLRNKNM